MLCFAGPFITIYRVKTLRLRRLAQFECFDIESDRYILYTLEWGAIASNDAGELARVFLAPSTFAPSTEEFRHWIENFT